MNAINIYVPSRMTKGKPDLPWMTVTIKRQLREPNGAAVKTSTAWETYKKQRNKGSPGRS